MTYSLSPEALTYIEEYLTVEDIPEVQKMVKDALTQPSDSYWHDQTLYQTHAVAFSHPYRLGGPEYLRTAVNLETALERLPENSASRETFGHWTYSSFDCLKVELLSSEQSEQSEQLQITLAAVMLYEMLLELDSYPVLDDDALIAAEHAISEKYFIEALEDTDQSDRDKARQYDFTHETEYVSWDEAYFYADPVENPVPEDWMPDNDYALEPGYWQSRVKYAKSIDLNDVRGLMDGKYY